MLKNNIKKNLAKSNQQQLFNHVNEYYNEQYITFKTQNRF